jgi:hypothetical protein
MQYVFSGFELTEIHVQVTFIKKSILINDKAAVVAAKQILLGSIEIPLKNRS